MGNSSESSPISGEVTIDLLPSAVNPATARIVGLNAVVDDEVDFRVGNILASLTVRADAGAIQLDLVEPGEAGEIEFDEFSQFGNLVGFEGGVDISVEPEPVDLSTLEPQPIDIEMVGLTANRTDIAVETDLLVDFTIPFEVGFLTLNAVLGVDGIVSANGSVPAANYTLEADNESLAWTTDRWSRNGVENTNSSPIAIDSLTIQGDGVVIDLDGDRSVATASVEGTVQLAGGSISAPGLEAGNDSVLIIASDTVLAAPEVVFDGGGTLLVDGTSRPLVAQGGRVGGAGEIDALTISEDASLDLVVGSTLVIGDSLDIQSGTVHIEDSSQQQGAFTLATVGQLTTTELVTLSEVFLNDEPLQATSTDNILEGHQGGGLFSTVVFTDTEISLSSRQAIEGDANGDGSVNIADFLILSRSFSELGDWLNGDFDGNGRVETPDFLALSRNFNRSATTIASVPEPGGSLYAVCILIGISLQRRRLFGQRN